MQCSGKQCLERFRLVESGCYDLTWKKAAGVSYNNVFSWAGAFLVEFKIADNLKWTVDLAPNIEAVGTPHLAAGGAPPLASAPPLQPGGAAPPGSIALLGDGPPASTVAGSDKRDAKAEKPVESQAKRARLSADSPADGVDGSHQPVTAAGEGAPPFGSSSPRWLLQKALRLYLGGSSLRPCVSPV